MTKDHWKAAAIALAGLLIVTNAAGFYTRRVLEAEAADRLNAARCATPAQAPQEVRITIPATLERVPAPAAAAQPGDRCIGGQLFRKTGNAWQQLGPC